MVYNHHRRTWIERERRIGQQCFPATIAWRWPTTFWHALGPPSPATSHNVVKLWPGQGLAGHILAEDAPDHGPASGVATTGGRATSVVSRPAVCSFAPGPRPSFSWSFTDGRTSVNGGIHPLSNSWPTNMVAADWRCAATTTLTLTLNESIGAREGRKF